MLKNIITRSNGATEKAKLSFRKKNENYAEHLGVFIEKKLLRFYSVAPLLHVSGIFIAFVALAGCATMAPEYTRPAAPVPPVWQGDAVKPAQKPIADIPWRDFFVDEKLRKVISMALENNRDLRVAALNMERFQAMYQIRRADFLPKVDASAVANYQRLPETLSGTGRAKNIEQYNVGLGVSSYELDLFGRVRSLKDQALEQYFGTEQAQRAVQITLISQVASSYLSLAADLERLQLAKDTASNQQEAYKLIKSRFDAGVSNSLSLNQAQSVLDGAKVDIARFRSLVAQDENALNFLVGSQIQTELLPQTLSESVTSLKNITPGTNSDVLLKRPDILQAESQLKALNANIGAARAAFFPRITLVSSIGFGSDELSSLFKSGAFAWSFAPRVTLPIFDGGVNKANLKVAEVDRDIALAQYEKAIQNAFREVADAFALSGTIDEQLLAQKSLTNATIESFKLSEARFDKGVDSYLSVLDSQRALYGARQSLIGTRLTKLINQVTLYKVLGGGA